MAAPPRPKGEHPVSTRKFNPAPPTKPSPPPVAVPTPGEPRPSEPHSTPHLHHINVPYVPASTNMAEVTVKAVLLGMALSVILGAANTYLGLKAGLTVAAAIPAAVVSLAVLRLFRKHTILENNMVQTIASAGTAVASGMLFTIPAMMILRASDGKAIWDDGIHYWETTIIGIVGGLLGVLFTVPLRRALIVEENLAFPEGVATAEVLKSGEGAGSGVGALLLGGAMGLGFKFLQSGIHLWSDSSLYIQRFGKTISGVGTQLSAALLGVGYIIGLRVSAIIFAGSVFAWLIAMPLISSTTGNADLAAQIPASNGCHDLIATYTTAAPGDLPDVASCLYKYQVRYLGVGAMLVGGFYSLFKLRKPLLRAVTKGLGGARAGVSGAAVDVPRTEVELSTRTTFAGVGILLVPMFFFYAYVTAPAGTGFDLAQWNYGVAAVMAIIMVVTGFLFSAVGAYMAGIVGSSNNPISGVTILTLMVSAFSLKFLGLGSDIGAGATIFVAAVIAIAGSIASDNLQDLKAGYMLGATPRRQQAMIAIGAVGSAFFLAPILNVLLTGPAGAVTLSKAPQANLMASIASGIFNPKTAGLPYPIIGIGILLAFALILLDQTIGRKRPAFRIPIMAVAVGMYLPIDTTAPIFIGGIVAWVTARMFKSRTGREMPEGSNMGVLFASGLIAGEALLGILTSGLAGIQTACPTGPWIPGAATINYHCSLDAVSKLPIGNAGQFLWLSNGTLDLPGLAFLLYIAVVMGYVALRKQKRETA